MEADDRLLTAVLSEGQQRGLLGPVPVEEQLRHARGFRAVIDETGGWDGRAVDLGSGGGLPGLVLAFWAPSSRWTLLDSRERAVAFLDMAVARLGLGARVEVRRARAEDAGRTPPLRAAATLVTARSFGPPATTAECAAPLLRPGAGRLVVSNPPATDAATRWPLASLEMLGMGEVRQLVLEGASFVVVSQATSCPERFPRRSGVPAKRPLF